MLWETQITELFKIKYPIIQGGLAYLAYSDLAIAVSNAGGLGQITAMSLESPDALRNEIHKVKSMTNKPFGVNFAIGQRGRKFDHMVQIAIDEDVPVISITGGDPSKLLKMLEGTSIKKIVLTASLGQAKKAEMLGANAVIVVGQEGGGHLGRNDTGTIVLTPHVVDSISIPVISSGGITDGRGLMAALALGAEGIEMGTRFIATKECINAHPNYKRALIESNEESTVIIKRSLGTPARALKNSWTDKILDIEKNHGDYKKLKSYISGEANKKYIYDGDSDKGFGWAGQGAISIKSIPSVEELINSIVKEAETIRRKW